MGVQPVDAPGDFGEGRILRGAVQKFLTALSGEAIAQWRRAGIWPILRPPSSSSAQKESDAQNRMSIH
jgi:hypothetical protein